METVEEVYSTQDRLAGAGITTDVEDQVTCCYALQDKVWALGPGAASWEFYTVLADAETPDGQLRAANSGTSCCAASANNTDSRSAACC